MFVYSVAVYVHINIIVPYYLHFSTLLTVNIVGGLVRQTGYSMYNYLKARNALKSVFALLNRVPAIDVASVKGIVLVCFTIVNLCIYVAIYVHSYCLRICT